MNIRCILIEVDHELISSAGDSQFNIYVICAPCFVDLLCCYSNDVVLIDKIEIYMSPTVSKELAAKNFHENLFVRNCPNH